MQNWLGSYLRIGFCVLLLSCFHPTKADQVKVDSFKAQLHQHPQQDIERAKLLNKISYYYWAISPDSMEAYARQLQTLSRKINYTKGIGQSFQHIGTAQWVRGNYNQALKELLQALRVYIAANDRRGIFSTYQGLGNIYTDQMMHDEALEYYKKAVEIARELGNDRAVNNTLNSIGTVYHMQQKYDLALSYYEKSLAYRLEQQDKRGVAESLNNIGLIYMAREEYEKALDHQLRSVAIKEELHDNNGLAMTYENIGVIYDEMGEYHKAYKAYIKGLEIAREMGAIKWMKDIYFNLSDNQERQGDHKKALEFRKEYEKLNDSILNSERIQEFATLRSEHEKEKQLAELELREKELLISEKEQKYSRLWHAVAAAGILMLLVTLILTIIFFRKSMKRAKELHVIKQARAKMELENIRLKELELNKELELKNRELSSYTLNFIRKKELIEELQRSINQLKKKNISSASGELKNLSSLIRESESLDKDWENFKIYFEQVHKDFFSLLKQQYPELTINDLRLCALLKMNLNLKEAGTILGISPNSVKTARYRLRKKLNLEQEDNLSDFIIALDSSFTTNGERLN